jgi:uncharacterized protein (UPF0332 family)
VAKVSRIDELIAKGKLKKAIISKEMYVKEFGISGKDLETSKKSFEDENYKWATIQAYYSIFHAVKALVYRAGYREESHSALKTAFKELYIDSGILPSSIYNTLERGMDLREMADYKETYSKNATENLIKSVGEALIHLEKEIEG